MYQAALRYSRKINGSLLLFLLLVLNVKMLVKLIAIIALLLINRKLFREKEIYRQQFTWLYWSMIALAVFNLLLTIPSFPVNYVVAVGTGIGFWLLCIGALSLIIGLSLIPIKKNSTRHSRCFLF